MVQILIKGFVPGLFSIQATYLQSFRQLTFLVCSGMSNLTLSTQLWTGVFLSHASSAESYCKRFLLRQPGRWQGKMSSSMTVKWLTIHMR